MLKHPPPSPEDLQSQLEICSLERSPGEDQRFLLSSSKYEKIKHQAQAALNVKVLDLYRKFKVCNKNISNKDILSTTAEHRPKSSFVQTNAFQFSLKGVLYSSSAYGASRATAQTDCESLV